MFEEMVPNDRPASDEVIKRLRSYFELIERLKELAVTWVCHRESPETTDALNHALTQYRRLIKAGTLRRPGLEFQTSIRYGEEHDLVAIIVEVIAALGGIKQIENK